MDGNGTGLSADEWLDILKWVCGAVAFLLWGYLNRLSGRVDKIDDRTHDHENRITKVETHLGLED